MGIIETRKRLRLLVYESIILSIVRVGETALLKNCGRNHANRDSNEFSATDTVGIG